MLGRLFHRSVALPVAVTDAIDRLGRLAEARPDLDELAAINVALLRAMYSRPLPPLALLLDQAHGATKLEGGIPLLRGEPFRLDARAVRDRFVELCGVMAQQGHGAAAELVQATRRDALPVATIATATLRDEPHAIASRAADLGLDAGLAATLLRFTLFPMLVHWMEEQRARFDLAHWRRGYCWCCGAWPLLGEYRGLEQSRFLRCGVCAAEWEIDRIVCPMCDNRAFHDFLSLSVEGEATHQRAVACARCHTYVKQIATLGPIPPPQLVVSDLATLDLDLIAAERSYMTPQ
jgi:FdhE protein